MPNPNLPDGFSFDDMPAGGDIGFDDLFANPDVAPNEPPTTVGSGVVPPVEPTPQANPAAPVTPTSNPTFELKTGTGTVYKSVEDAIKGIEQKDTLIENLRTKLALQTGVDPITQQRLNFQPQPNPEPQVVNYASDSKKYMEDLVAAAESGDDARYAQVQQKFMLDTLAPISGIITNAAKDAAVKQITAKYSDFDTVRNSAEFKAVLEENPELKDAIALAEQDYRFHERLPGLLKIGYEAAQGRRVPELVRQMQQAAAAQTPTTQPARTTTPSATLAPPEPGVKPDIKTAEGRKALIQQLESQGVGNVRW